MKQLFTYAFLYVLIFLSSCQKEYVMDVGGTYKAYRQDGKEFLIRYDKVKYSYEYKGRVIASGHYFLLGNEMYYQANFIGDFIYDGYWEDPANYIHVPRIGNATKYQLTTQ